MRIIKRGGAYPTIELECKSCGSVLEIEHKDWRAGIYGGEMVCQCPVCMREIIQPGTEYQGDF